MKTIITIGREYGSAGHSIGKIPGRRAGNRSIMTRSLLERAAKDSGLCKELFENHDEKPTNSFLYSLVMDTYSFGYGSTMIDMPLNQKVFLAQFDSIKKIAQDGPCVIVGRWCGLCTGGISQCTQRFHPCRHEGPCPPYCKAV